MHKMNRRRFIRLSSTVGLTPLLPSIFTSNAAADESYGGDLILTLNVFGAWDVSSFCDPKLNTPGELDINNWASGMDEIPKAGNIPYAPVWGNTELFDKYHQDMLVINGIDAQTNSHSTGQVVAFSGRLSPGFPTITSLAAAIRGPELAMSYINNGGYSSSGGLVSVTQLGWPGLVPTIANYNSRENDVEHKIFPVKFFDRLQTAKLARIARQLGQGQLFPRHHAALSQLYLATENLSDLERINPYLPTQFIEDVDDLGQHPAWQQAEMAMIAFKAGLTISADLTQGDNFDTHSNHDQDHEPMMRRLNRDIDTIWQLAEQYNISDRVTLVVNSEFSRTPSYNADDGKDHWPIGSMLIMKKGADWTNRVVGRTDELQNAVKINPATLSIDEDNGSLIYFKDVMMSLRRHLEIAEHPLVSQFDLHVDTEFDFFNPNLSTPQLYS